VQIDFRRWGVFNVVGIGGFVVQISAIALLTRHFGWPAFAATVVALELAAFQNFLAHSRWTWRERPVQSRVQGRAPGARSWLRRYWRYQVAKTAALAANLAITALLLHAGVPPEVANTAAVLACAIPNYLVSEHLVFGMR
jgi:putative flippase GtrA